MQKFQVHMLSILPAAHPPRARNVRCTAPACQLTTEREEEEEGASCVEFSKRAESPHSSPPSTWEMVGLGVEEGVNPPPPTPHPLNLCVYECVEYMGTLGGPLHYHACAGWE